MFNLKTMNNLKDLSIADLKAIHDFSQTMEDFWEKHTDKRLKLYYLTIKNETYNEISDRLSNVFPELNYLIE